MSESKYSPPVNMPERVPGDPANPASMIVQFLHSSGQWVGCGSDQLGLYQVGADEIALGYRVEAADGKLQFRELVRFPGKLVLEERKVVIP